MLSEFFFSFVHHLLNISAFFKALLGLFIVCLLAMCICVWGSNVSRAAYLTECLNKLLNLEFVHRWLLCLGQIFFIVCSAFKNVVYFLFCFFFQ